MVLIADVGRPNGSVFRAELSRLLPGLAEGDLFAIEGMAIQVTGGQQPQREVPVRLLDSA